MKYERKEGVRLTRWLAGREKESSGHAGGRLVTNREWCELERAALAAKGVRVVVARNPDDDGQVALFRVS